MTNKETDKQKFRDTGTKTNKKNSKNKQLARLTHRKIKRRFAREHATCETGFVLFFSGVIAQKNDTTVHERSHYKMLRISPAYF